MWGTISARWACTFSESSCQLYTSTNLTQACNPGTVFKRLTTDGGNTWCFGSLTDLSVPTRKNSSLAAAVSWTALEGFEIQVYFQDDHNRIRNIQYSGKDKRWFEECPTIMDSLKRMSGTSIVTSYDHFSLDKAMVKKVVFTLSPARDVCEFAYVNKQWCMLCHP